MADTTGKVIRLTEYDLMRTKKSPGNYYFTTDTRKLYRDDSETVRTLIDAIMVPTEKQRMYENFQKAYGKLVYCFESSNLYLWENKWILIKGNPEYPSAYQYVDGEIFGVGDMTDDVKGNGILGDGSVVIRDYNRIIKAKIYINEETDEVIISSYLGGGIRLLPNGNMEDTGALYLNPTTINEDKVDGLGKHFCQFENVNGEIFVSYEDPYIQNDKNKYQNSEHKYMVWHEGNLDAYPLINDLYLKKLYDDNEIGKSSIYNNEETRGIEITSENRYLNANTKIATHHYNPDNSYILNEISTEDTLDPSNNIGLYTIKRENDLEFHLRKDKERPILSTDLNEDDILLNKGEIIDLLNQTIYSAVLEERTESSDLYVINDNNLVKLLEDGLVISVNFTTTSTSELIRLKIGANGSPEVVDLNTDMSVKNMPIGFKTNCIYQLIRNRNKWLVINPQLRAGIEENEYGLVRVTGTSSDTSSFSAIIDSIVDLNDVQYQYDGKYSFVSNIINGSHFPVQEQEYISDVGMEYTLTVNSSSGRGAGVNSDDNCIEQILTNQGTGRKYRRFLNRSFVLRTSYDQGDLDNNGRTTSSNTKVIEVDRFKVDKNSLYRFNIYNLTNVVQCSVAKLTKTGCSSKTSFMRVNSMTPITSDENTEYFRLIFKYEDDTMMLSPSLVSTATINITQVGFSEWVEIFDNDKMLDKDKISRETISLPANSWVRKNGMYEQTFYMWYVNENTLVEGNLDINNQNKLEVSHIESFNYGFKVVSLAKPTENISMTVTYTETKEA